MYDLRMIGKVAKCQKGILGVIKEVDINGIEVLYKGYLLKNRNKKWQSKNPVVVADSESDWYRKNLQMEG